MDGFLAWLFGLIAIVIPGFGTEPAAQYNGYVEARYVYAAASTAGVSPVRDWPALRGLALAALRPRQ